MIPPPLSAADYQALARFRRGLRAFLHFSEQAAQAAGLPPAQHQLLLAIKAVTVGGTPEGPTIGDMAEWLVLRHHSAVELVDRAASAGLVRRHADPADARYQRLTLTSEGEGKLAVLSEQHRAELRRLREETFVDLMSIG